MNIVNLHDDIGTDIYLHQIQQPNRLDDYHYPKLKKGGISHTCIVCFFDGSQSFKEMQEMILYSEQAIINSHYFSFAQDKKIQAFLAVEGMCGIHNEVADKIQWMYDHHVRIASLVWNENNALACGAKSGNKPLTPLGVQAIKKMNEIKMLIDVSHLCSKGVSDVLYHSNQPIIATHSNAYTICPHVRNLQDEQLQAITNKGGLIGCVPVYYFVGKEGNQNMDAFIKMIQYIIKTVGIHHVAFGFDFMDYASEENEMIDELVSIESIPLLVKALQQHFTPAEVETLLANNALHFLQANQ